MTVAEEELAGQVPLDSSAYESIAEKLVRKMEEHLRSATLAFADQEFAAAFQTLDRLPESRRTPVLRELHRQCLELKKAQKHIETAERSAANGDYAFAVRTLEKIPEYARSGIISDIIEEAHTLARIGTHLEQARRHLADYNYNAAVRSLQAVPEEDRVEEFTTLWNEANEKQSLVRRLRDELFQKWDELNQNSTVDLCAQTLSLLDQLLELHPNDESLKEQRNRTNELQQRVRHRNELCAVAQERFDEFQYAEVVELLQQIDVELRQGKAARLEAKAVKCLREVQQLTDEILAALSNEEYRNVSALLNQLDQLQLNAAENIVKCLSDGACDGLLIGLARHIRDDAGVVTLFDRFIDAIDLDRLCGILSKPGETFLQEFPDQQTALQSVLLRILDSLTDHPEKIHNRLKALEVARDYLGDQAVRLDNWRQLIQSLDEFDQIQSRRWSRFRRIVPNPQISTLVSTGRRLAEAADLVLPSDANRWQSLQKISGGRFNSNAKPVCRVYSMIARYLETKEWSSGPMTLITIKRTSIVAVLALAAAAVQFLLSHWFRIDGSLGFAAILFLLHVALLTILYRVSPRIL